MKCSQKAIQTLLKNYVFETFQRCGPWREYTYKTTKHEDQYIERVLKQNDHLPLQDITNIAEFPISHWTVAHHWSEAGLGSYITAEKPGLQHENIAAWLQ